MSMTGVLPFSPAEATSRLLARARGYVEQETPSGYEPGLIALAEQVAYDLQAAGAGIERHDATGRGRNLVARIPGRELTAAPLLLLAHLDTVHPVGSLAQRPFTVHDGRVTGPGVYDMKMGVALLVEALTVLREHGRAPRRPVTFLVTCDEEIGSDSARPLIEALAPAAGAALVPEPCLPDGGIKTARKGVNTYRLRVTGLAGHAGTEAGTAVSAIAELLDQCRAVTALARPDLGTTINIGRIGGGTATNVVAAEAWAGIDVRLALPEEGERVHAALLALEPVRAGATVQAVRTESRPPLVRNEAVLRLYQHARALGRELGVDLAEGASGGGSDGSLAAFWGAPTLDGLGPRGGGAHAPGEHVLLEDLPFRLAFHITLLDHL
jgi:glutamate carboxypeptidase